MAVAVQEPPSVGTSPGEPYQTELAEDLIARVASELDDAREALEPDQLIYFYTRVFGGE